VTALAAPADVRLRVEVYLDPAERYDRSLYAQEVKRGMQGFGEVRMVVFYFDSGEAVRATEYVGQRRKSTGAVLATAEPRDLPVSDVPEQVRMAAHRRLLAHRGFRRACLICAVLWEPCVHVAGALTGMHVFHVEGATGAFLPYLQED
jgi:hypothetical protein